MRTNDLTGLAAYDQMRGELARQTKGQPRSLKMVQCKFVCQHVTEKFNNKREKNAEGTYVETGEKEKYCEEVELSPVYAPPSQPDHPNHAFFKWTPSGTMRMEINNPNAWGSFVVGKEYPINIGDAE